MILRLSKFRFQIHTISLFFCFLMVTAALPHSTAAVTYNPLDSSVRDYWPTEAWRNATPEEKGFDSAKLNVMMDYIEDESLRLDSILIVRGGYLVFEEYPRYVDADTRHAIHSCTKSFASALVGIAIDQGYLSGVDMTLPELFPNRTIDNMDDWKEDITLEHLLSMKSGFEWDEWSEPYGAINNDLTGLLTSPDWVQFALDRPVAYEPGTHWTYNSGVSHLLTAIVVDHSGVTPLAFVMDNLFSPLGIDNYDFYWQRDPDGYVWSGGGLYMTSRALAKFGYLYLNNGTWDGTQVISSDWVGTSTQNHHTFDSIGGYGYQWWTYSTNIANFYSAVGYAGQYIIIAPEFDMVVVFTSDVPPYGYWPHLSMFLNLILDAVITEDSTESSAIDVFTISVGFSLIIPILVAGIRYRFQLKQTHSNIEVT